MDQLHELDFKVWMSLKSTSSALLEQTLKTSPFSVIMKTKMRARVIHAGKKALVMHLSQIGFLVCFKIIYLIKSVAWQSYWMRKEKVFWIPCAPTGDWRNNRQSTVFSEVFSVLDHFGITVGIKTKGKGSGKRKCYLLSLQDVDMPWNDGCRKLNQNQISKVGISF